MLPGKFNFIYKFINLCIGRKAHFLVGQMVSSWSLDGTLRCVRGIGWNNYLRPGLLQTVYIVLISINREVSPSGTYGSALECVPQEVSVISTVSAGDGYFLWFH